MNISSSDIHFQTMKDVRLELRGPPRGPELSLEPAVENWVTDTGAHGQGMAEAKSKEIVFWISDGDEAKISNSEKEV